MVAQNYDAVIEQLTVIEETMRGADKSAAARARIESGRILAQQKGARKAIPQALQKRLSTELTITAHTVETRIAAAAGADEEGLGAGPAIAGGAEVDDVEPAADWVITRTSDDADRAPSYWAGGQQWLVIEAEMLGVIRTFESAAAAKATYRTAHGSFPDTHSVVQLSPEQIAAIEATAADMIARWVAEQPDTAELGDVLEDVGAGELEDVLEDELEDGDTGAAAIVTQEATKAAVVTGEVVSLTEAEARALTDEIRSDIAGVGAKIERAYFGRAWTVLGYGTWDDYCDAEFASSFPRLPRPERVAIVCALSEADMSGRSIAAAIGVTEGTVRNDLKSGAGTVRNDLKSGAQNYAPAPEDTTPAPTKPPTVTGADGKTYPAKPKKPTTPAAKKPTMSPTSGRGKSSVTVSTTTPAVKKPIDSTIAPLMENFMIAISSKAAVVAVTFVGDEECVIPLGGRLDKRITPDVAEQLWYHLRGAMPKIADLIEQLGRRAGKTR
jgi:hypothetical protein